MLAAHSTPTRALRISMVGEAKKRQYVFIMETQLFMLRRKDFGEAGANYFVCDS